MARGYEILGAAALVKKTKGIHDFMKGSLEKMLNNEHSKVQWGSFDPEIVKNDTKLLLEKLDKKSWIYDEVSRNLAGKIGLEKNCASAEKLSILYEAQMVLGGSGALSDLDPILDKVCQKLISLILEIYQRPVGLD
jgi:hypothetical protein